MLTDTDEAFSAMLTDQLTTSMLTDALPTGDSPATQAPLCQDENVDLIVYSVLIPLVSILGLLGNTLSMVVLHRESTNKAAVLLLQALALSDNIFLLIFAVLFGVFKGIIPKVSDIDTTRIQPYIIKYINPICYIGQTAIVWSTILLAINRYIAICKPLRAPVWLTLKNTKRQIFLAFSFAIILNIPRFFQIVIIFEHDEAVNVMESSIGRTSLFGKIYTNGLFTIVVFLVPMVVIIGLNAALINALRSARRERRRSITRAFSSADQNITMVMIIIIVVFIVCHLPEQVFQTLLANNWLGSAACTKAYLTFGSLCNTLLAFNSSVNFIIYYMFRRRFRRIFLSTFCSCLKLNLSRMVSLSSSPEVVTPHRPNHENGLLCTESYGHQIV